MASTLRPLWRPFRHIRSLSTTSSSPRHLLSISNLTPLELRTLVNNATAYKHSKFPATWPLRNALSNKTIALLFSKRSTRTRVSSEGAVVAMGGHPMFLGRDDIQLGVNESLYDSSVVISSMVSGMVARVGPHADIANLAKDSSVPVINALCDTYHPMQIIADLATLTQAYSTSAEQLQGLKIAWVGDANNVLFDMCIGARKLGIDMAVATPRGYEIPPKIKQEIDAAGPGKLFETNVPEEAVKEANVIVTDTWVSMGQEDEKVKRLKAFAGYQVTEDMARRGGAAQDWKFMHCLPRHPEEVSDEVFYGKRSLVFPEAENRLWSAVATLEAFVSPSLSRSSSFAPGPHRRSHPNLHHLSLAPLTPKYPIDPADYAAYFDPATSELHPSASISQIASLPSPGGILATSHSAAHSRASSRTRLKKKTRSNVSIAAATSDAHGHLTHTPSGALTSEGFGHKKAANTNMIHVHRSDSSWLIQTGLALTEGSRESKGQSWISKRDSSTSLHTPVDERPALRSGRATPSVSRRSSQRRSRRSLAMTPVPFTPVVDEAAPDWADAQTQAEIAARVENDLADEFDEDPYGILDFEGQFDSEDEEDVRKEISKYRLGRWMDGLVDVFLRLEDFPESLSADLEAGNAQTQMPLPGAPAVKEADTASLISDNPSVETPPEKPNGVWDDVAWFGRMIVKTVRS
ncbi:ornithine carbamoyltransferase [Rhinocladiella mackenziei CBS 650.93]|uniref:Ornithine carbamoyltransferase, mitochondrial n=1 Tax=Rhinocladiella mackenziei CBS 650.93 TaxID=1442369 RepID=A0A0D2H2E3_9EURO|nr:ornithine carbamoyltransferase [Rhinocladiella mackenziei CBS 650.93]KIX04573.1 ornithine carbamoyltransferase [Rhinocladiella mackenziei CBS 650.93]